MSFKLTDKKQDGSIHLVAVVVVVIVLVAGAGFLVAAKTLGNHKVVTSPQEIKSMLTDVQTGKYDAKCTFKATSTQSSAAVSISSGTFYISGSGNRRVDGIIADKPGHVVQKDKTVYIWTDGSTEGGKLPVTTSGSSESLSDKLTNSPEKYQVGCQKVGRLKDTTFTVPSDIKFVDLNQSLKKQSTTTHN